MQFSSLTFGTYKTEIWKANGCIGGKFQCPGTTYKAKGTDIPKGNPHIAVFVYCFETSGLM